jgi:GT2 family glycosyltransferase
MEMPPLSIIILNWDGKHLLEANLPSVIKAADHYPNTKEIIVVDNGSKDGSAAFLKFAYPQIKILELHKNMRYTGGNNAGVEFAGGDIVILLNNDMKVEEDFILPLVEGFKQKSDVFAVSSQIFFQDGSKRREESGLTTARFKNGWFFAGHVTDQTKIDEGLEYENTFWVGGGAAAFDRLKFLEIKLDTLYDPFYCEDLDISYQAWKRGYVCLFSKNSIVHHMHRATNQTRFGNKFVDSTIKRNNYLFIWKNITDKDLIWQHILKSPHIISSSIKEEGIGELFIFFKALMKLPECMKKRRENKKYYKSSDKEVFNLFYSDGARKKISSIDFSLGEFKENISGDWHHKELNFRWIGKNAVCYLFSSDKAKKLIVKGYCGFPAEILKEKEFILSVLMNGKLVVREPLQNGEINIEYDIHPAKMQMNEIVLSVNNTFNLKKSGLGEDGRDLGIIINKIEII